MLRSLKDLERYTVSATDGDIGNVMDFFLDDERWAIRYLVVETGALFERREVLISPIAFRRVEWSGHRFYVDLTKSKVQCSPSVETDKPVSRQFEWDNLSHYGYPYYWGQSGLWGASTCPGLLATAKWSNASNDPSFKPHDVHLRSASEVRGYHVHGSDEEIGHVRDFVVDDETWEVRYLVIATSNWGFGKKVLVAPQWTDRISWAEGTVTLGLSREAIRNSPEWTPVGGIDHEYEAKLNAHFEPLVVRPTTRLTTR